MSYQKIKDSIEDSPSNTKKKRENNSVKTNPKIVKNVNIILNNIIS